MTADPSLVFHFVGRPFDEARLLHVADAFQRETDWHRRRPPLSSNVPGES